jgi:DNA-binding LytR/AlgR family response regulator
MKCIIIDDDKVSRLVIEKYIQKTEFLSLEVSFENPFDAINYLVEKNEIDLIFLDIEMPEMNGVELIENSDNLPQVIIVSAKDKYAVQAIEYDVTAYLLKPVSYAKFFKAVTKANERITSEKENDKTKGIFIKSNSSSFIRLLYDDIYWIEALENYVVINTEDEKHTIHFTMKALLNKLPSDKFKRIHRSFIVNIDKVNMIEDNMVILKIGSKKKSIPIAKSYKDKLLKEINIVSK